MDGDSKRVFPDEFDDHFPVGQHAGNRAFFGRNVMRGLIEGIDDFIHERQSRWNLWGLAKSVPLRCLRVLIDHPNGDGTASD